MGHRKFMSGVCYVIAEILIWKFGFYDKRIAFFADLGIIKAWQRFGNRKSVSQNKLCNRSKKSAFLHQKSNKIV